MIISSLSSGLLRGALRDELDALAGALVEALDVGFERLELGTDRVEAAVSKLVRPIAESAQTMVEDVRYLAAEGGARGGDEHLARGAREPQRAAVAAARAEARHEAVGQSAGAAWGVPDALLDHEPPHRAQQAEAAVGGLGAQAAEDAAEPRVADAGGEVL